MFWDAKISQNSFRFSTQYCLGFIFNYQVWLMMMVVPADIPRSLMPWQAEALPEAI